MHEFSRLYRRLDETTKTGEKTAALADYFALAGAADAAWAVYFLIGRRPKRPVKMARLRRWAAEQAGINDWMFNDCHDVVGDLAETITRVLPTTKTVEPRPLHEWVDQHLLPLRDAPEAVQRRTVTGAWKDMDADSRLVWNKILTSGLRAGVSKAIVVRGLSVAFGLEESVLVHRMAGDWPPSAEFFGRLVAQDTSDTSASRPYPFCPAHLLESDPTTLGEPEQWMAEWKWDGMRVQIIRRHGQVFMWTRQGELVTDRFPETAASAMMLPDGTVLDGELLAWGPDGVLPFGELQRRLGRKTLGPKLLRDTPICCIVFDLLEYESRSIRDQPLRARRRILAKLLPDMPGSAAMCLSKTIDFETWADLGALREESRNRRVEGLVLKDLDTPYVDDRVTKAWWSWKADPLTIAAVLIYAERRQSDSGGGYTDYTFAVWDEANTLVPFTHAHQGLTDSEVKEIDRFVKQHTVERFGPVSSARPELVFEISFEAIRTSTRHKSGVAVRSARIQRWLEGTDAKDAGRLATLKSFLPPR